MAVIRIGGKDVEYRIKMQMAFRIMKKYNAVYMALSRATKSPKVLMPNWFFTWAAWKVLEKRGIWPFRKPFRSLRHMAGEIELQEFKNVITMLGKAVLNTQTADEPEEDREPGKVVSLNENISRP